MSKKASKQFSKAFETIEALKASNRKAFIKILAAMAAVLLLGLGRTALDVYGLIPSEPVGTIASGAVYLIAIFMAFIAGQSGISIAKNRREIDSICDRTGITKDRIKAHR